MGGSSKKVTVGYLYGLAIHMGLARGPVNSVKHVKVGDLTAWTGAVTSTTYVDIEKPDLFGGESKEGGVNGSLDILMGAPTQTFPSDFKTLMGGLVPDFRGITTFFWRGDICANNPYPKAWAFRAARWSEGWDIDAADPYRASVWYADKARILIDEGNGVIEAMNPAHIIYECLTNRAWGRGLSPVWIDDESFTSAANVLCSELFGLCLKWNRQGDINEFIDSVLSHIGANLYSDPQTGKLVLRLTRADYDAATLVVFDYESGLIEVNEDETGGGDNAFNEIVVNYTDPITGNEASVRDNSPGLAQAMGEVVSTTAAYPGIPTANLAMRVARRDLDMQTVSKRLKVTLDRRAWKLAPGMPFKITAPDRGFDEIILRAGTIEDTEITDGRIVVTAVQDFFGLPSSGYGTPEPATAWTPPDNTAVAATVKRLDEITYRDLAATNTDADLAIIQANTDAGFFATLAVQPTGTSLAYEVASAATGETMQVRGSGNWTPSETISSALGYYDTLMAFDPAVVDLSELQVGEAILINDEFVRADSIDTVAGTVTIARGCSDTLPQLHDVGDRAWFYEDLFGTDARDYATSETVDVSVLTITASDRLDIGDVVADTISIEGRQGRPYPPGDLKVNGDPFGSLDPVYAGELIFTWTHRDRLLQDDRLVEHEAASIGPEAGTTYTIRIYDGVTLLRTTTGISSDTWTYTSGMIATDGEPAAEAWTIEVESVRSTLTSWQMYRFDVPRRQSVTLTPGTGTLLFTGRPAEASPSNVTLTVGLGTLQFNGLALGGNTITTAKGSLTFTGLAPTVSP